MLETVLHDAGGHPISNQTLHPISHTQLKWIEDHEWGRFTQRKNNGDDLEMVYHWIWPHHGLYPCIVGICHIHNVPGEILPILTCRTSDILIFLQTDRSEGYWLENDLLLRAWLLDFHNIPWERQRRYLHGVDCKSLNSLTIHPWGWLGARRESHRISNFTRFQNLIIEFSLFWVVYQS